MQSRIFFLLLAFILSGCAVTNGPAPIVYNHKEGSITTNESDDAKFIQNDEDIDSLPNIEVVNDDKDEVVPEEKPAQKNTKIIDYEVNMGETIEEIALKYNQSADEIAKLNNLHKPYKLEEFQVLKIQVPVDFVENKIPSTKTTIEFKTSEFIPPLDGKLISKFGDDTIYGKNKGINIEAKPGTKIVAAASGKVIYADYDATFGNLVIIKLDNKNIVTSYAHLEDIVLAKGASVKQGDVIGYVGSSGKVKTPQLQFGIREGKVAKDPLKYVNY
jgi:murein DD-endopeptidase MepM/ murein hydrolase activator NlpD